jgi:hypothetical protein
MSSFADKRASEKLLRPSGVVTRAESLAWPPCNTVKLPEHLAMSTVPLWLRKELQHQGESHGYGNNLLNRDNRQPSPKDLGLWVQFTD